VFQIVVVTRAAAGGGDGGAPLPAAAAAAKTDDVHDDVAFELAEERRRRRRRIDPRTKQPTAAPLARRLCQEKAEAQDEQAQAPQEAQTPAAQVQVKKFL